MTRMVHLKVAIDDIETTLGAHTTTGRTVARVSRWIDHYDNLASTVLIPFSHKVRKGWRVTFQTYT